MPWRSVFGEGLGLVGAVIEDVDLEVGGDGIVVSVRPRAAWQRRCGRCGRRCSGYDGGDGRRRWRALDMGSTRVWVEADGPRVVCPDHGVVVAGVPWARHGAGHTRGFDDQVAWLATQGSKSMVVKLMRIAWRTVGAILERVNADIEASVDRLGGLVRIGIDEIAYKRGHRYVTVVVDHDRRRLVWAGVGREAATLHRFFDELGPQRAAQLTHVSADMAPWIARVVAARAPQALRCADPFHLVAWATEALDVERRHAWNEASGRARIDTDRRSRNRGAGGAARQLKLARYALWHNPDKLTDRQRGRLDWIAQTQPRLWRAYLLKEGLRWAVKTKGETGKQALGVWISWAKRSRIPAFVALAERIADHRPAIEAMMDSGLSNGLIESTNTKIRLLIRTAFGFHHPEALIALALLALGGHCPELPGRHPQPAAA